MPDSLNNGAFNLGAVLAGGGRVREAAKSAEELRLMNLANLHAETDRKVDQAIEEQRKRAAMQSVAGDQSIPDTIRNLVLAGLGSQYSGATQGQLHAQEFGNRADAVSAAVGGDLAGANAHLVGVAKGPLQLAKVEGNTVINPYVSGGGADAHSTDIGRALAGAADALSGQRNAAANLSNVKAAAGGFKPSGPGKLGKPEKFSEPTQARVIAAFNGSTAMETDFLRWRQAHPEIANGNVALDTYRMEAGSHGPHIIDPSLPGSMTIQPPAEADRSLEANLRGDGAPPDVVEAVTRAVQGGGDFNIPAGKVPVHKAPGPIDNTKALNLLHEARDAIKAGKDPAAVKARLQSMGYHLIADRL